MEKLFKVISSSDKTTIKDEVYGIHDVRYLTLTDVNPKSENRYYVQIGADNDIEWQPGDRIMVELSLLAYNSQGQWHLCHRNDMIKFVEIDNSNNRFKM
jgi:hypothetical protein